MKKFLLVSILLVFSLISLAQSEFAIPTGVSDFDLKGPVKTVKTIYPERDMVMEDSQEIVRAYEILTFDESGNLLSQISYDKAGEEINAILYNYDSNGKLVSLSGRERGEQEQSIGDITIENGKIVAISIDDTEGKSTISMEYDSNGRLLSQTISGMSEGQEIEMNINMKYDSNGNLVEESFGMMGMVMTKTVYEYNDKNQRVKSLEYMYMFAQEGTEPEPMTTTFEYNEMGDLSRSISDNFFSEDKEATVYEYEYDSRGNYTNKVVYFLYSIQELENENWKDTAQIESEETREIQYY